MSATTLTYVSKCHGCGNDFKEDEKAVVALWPTTVREVTDYFTGEIVMGVEMDWTAEVAFHVKCFAKYANTWDPSTDPEFDIQVHMPH